MREREEAARHAKAGADFTQAATTVVTAGLPAPTTGSGVATQAIGEAAQGIVEAETTSEPGTGTKIWNAIKGFFSWLNPFD